MDIGQDVRAPARWRPAGVDPWLIPASGRVDLAAFHGIHTTGHTVHDGPRAVVIPHANCPGEHQSTFDVVIPHQDRAVPDEAERALHLRRHARQADPPGGRHREGFRDVTVRSTGSWPDQHRNQDAESSHDRAHHEDAPLRGGQPRCPHPGGRLAHTRIVVLRVDPDPAAGRRIGCCRVAGWRSMRPPCLFRRIGPSSVEVASVTAHRRRLLSGDGR